MTPISFCGVIYPVKNFVNRIRLKMRTIEQTGRMWKVMADEFEERLKKRLVNVDTEKMVFDLSRFIFWPLIIVIILALMFPIFYPFT
ncbi:hypothetical protein NPIL_620311 [Nephila pilipes]|uniref:Uncharacterized protein n=1 Tax=Nephila pilipes TaxID=299642 RepID=A0A8X6MPW1_NEPPI|nr:hypothetical protein NPIL_620311 [Nephila pilipes]